MSDPVDQEIEAIKKVLEALTPLSPKARSSVLDYAVKRLDLVMPEAGRLLGTASGTSGTHLETGKRHASEGGVHIKDLKEQKKPRSANEMAALVAYYLADMAPEADRKKTVNYKDIETYFNIARFPFPNQIRATLPNAKTAGYFDSVGEGEYKLNAVGHNLVVHSMPRGKAASVKQRQPRRASVNKRTKATTQRTLRK